MNRCEYAAAIHKRYIETNNDISILLSEGERFEIYDALFHTGSKLLEYFATHDNILISVSGGSDSDCIVHLICSYFPEFLDKCHFVFVNTGLEYDATKRHLCDLEKLYGIKIERIRGKSVVWAVRNYGFPILSKIKSKFLNYYLRGVPSGEKYVFMDGYKVARLQFTVGQKELARYLKANGIMVSEKCCDVSKKSLFTSTFLKTKLI